MIVSASSPEIGSTVIFSGRWVGSIGTVSVTTTPARSESPIAFSPSAEKSACVRNAQTSVAPCSFSASRADDQRAARRRDVVADDRDLVADAAGDLGHLDGVGARPHLVHDREAGADHLGEPDGVLGATGIGGDGDDALSLEPEVAEVAAEQRQRRHVVDRDVEEALDLARMEVHRQDAVGAGELEHVGDVAAGDRLARLGLPVLARVREPRDHGGDALRRRELCGLDHQAELHQVPVDRRTAGLDEEEVGAADRLAVAAVGLAVRERLEHDLAELDAELLGDRRGEIGMRACPRRPSAASTARARDSDPRSPRGAPEARRASRPGSRTISVVALSDGHSPPCSPGAAGSRPARPAGRPR